MALFCLRQAGRVWFGLTAGMGLFKLPEPYPTLTSAGWVSAMGCQFRYPALRRLVSNNPLSQPWQSAAEN